MGAVFQLSPPAQAGGGYSENAIYSFNGGSNNGDRNPSGSLVEDVSGNLYGTTTGGSASSSCTVGANVRMRNRL